MDLWIRDIVELSNYSLSTVTNLIKKGLLISFLKDRKTFITLQSDNIFKVKKELDLIYKESERLREVKKRARLMTSGHYKVLAYFCETWGYQFNKENFTINGFNVEFRKYKEGDKSIFTGKRYFINDYDLYLDYYLPKYRGKSTLKPLLERTKKRDKDKQ